MGEPTVGLLITQSKREEDMPHYMYQASYSPEAIKTLVNNPQDRTGAAKAAIEANGGTMIGEPKLTERPQEQGTVRVNIVVDGSGKVIQASPNYESAVTTLTDSYHVNLAMRAAKTAQFTADPTKPRRTGYITIRFDLE